MSKISRRDFLKVTSVLSGAMAFSNLASKLGLSEVRSDALPPNILIFIFDAMSAKNLSLYGYRRKTTPNLERFAERATVYHAHYSAGNFTTPGTASFLTGMYPWTHRAINESGLIARHLIERNLFRLIGERYHRMAFSQNMWPNYFFGQFEQDINTILPPGSFSTVEQVIGARPGEDLTTGYRAYDDFLFQDGNPPASLVFGLAARVLLRREAARAQNGNYPRGIPRTGNYPIFFQLKDVFDGLISTIEELRPPYLAYFHLWPPHAPYKPSKGFDDVFRDNWRPIRKPEHDLGNHTPNSHLNDRRKNYDEYVANVDAEFGRLVDFLSEKRILDQSYVVVSSDHGESFERGVDGHITPLLYDPLTLTPLLISSPGQKSRQDIYSPTSSIDIAPTLVRLTGGDIPDWCEGELLPGFGGKENLERSIFMVEAKENPAFAPLSIATVAMRKGKYKMIYYTGYGGYGGRDVFELYDLENDLEELNDLYPGNSSIARILQEELLVKFREVNSNYRR